MRESIDRPVSVRPDPKGRLAESGGYPSWQALLRTWHALDRILDLETGMRRVQEHRLQKLPARLGGLRAQLVPIQDLVCDSWGLGVHVIADPRYQMRQTMTHLERLCARPHRRASATSEDCFNSTIKQLSRVRQAVSEFATRDVVLA